MPCNSVQNVGTPEYMDMQVKWLPGSLAKLAIAAQQQIFVYDLSVAADAPLIAIQLPQTQARLTGFTIFRDMSLSAEQSEVRVNDT